MPNKKKKNKQNRKKSDNTQKYCNKNKKYYRLRSINEQAKKQIQHHE
jgi:hypothetical protein